MTESRTPYILSDMTADLNADDPAALRARLAELEGQIDAALEEIDTKASAVIFDGEYEYEYDFPYRRGMQRAARIVKRHTGRGHP